MLEKLIYLTVRFKIQCLNCLRFYVFLFVFVSVCRRTTNLIRHLKSNHTQQHNKYKAETKASQSTTSAFQQPTLSETLKRKEKLPENRDGGGLLSFGALGATLRVAFSYFTDKGLPAQHNKLCGHLQVLLVGRACFWVYHRDLEFFCMSNGTH